MAYIYAQINKNTLAYIFEGKRVSKDYIVSKTGIKSEKLDKWLNTTDTLLPIINQAKSIASCLHIPFAGFYMNPEHVKLKAIPAVKNYKTLIIVFLESLLQNDQQTFRGYDGIALFCKDE